MRKKRLRGSNDEQSGEPIPGEARETGVAPARRSTRVRNRLVLSVAMVSVAVAAAGAPAIAAAIDTTHRSQRLVELAEANREAVVLAHSLADERDAMTEFVAAGRSSASGAGVSESQRARVDRQVTELRPDAPGALRRLLDELPRLRQQALTGHGSALDVFEGYTRTLQALQDLSGALARDMPERADTGSAAALAALGRAGEQASATRGLLLGALSGDGGRTELSGAAQRTDLREQAALADFEQLAPDDVRERFASTVNGTEVTAADRYLDRLTDASRLSASDLLLDDKRVAAALSARIDRMRGVESALATAELERLEQLRDDDVEDLEIQIGLVGACLLLALGASVSTGRSMTRPLAALRLGARRVAADPVTEEPVAYRGKNDEFADAVRSVNDLQQAVRRERERSEKLDADRTRLVGERRRLADERTDLRRERDQAVARLDGLRERVHGSFVSLALRNLSLIERQLAVIEGLEERETDPDRLETLFQLDHLATGMRRYSENLLVIAGSEHRVTHPGPVPLLDVLRASISEVEKYDRVRIESLPPNSYLTGHAADSISHLVAELLENATAFSPPEAPVQVSGWLLDTGELMLSVQDQGIGMAPARYEELNNRLAEPVPDTSKGPNADDPLGLGLYVVTRLAAKHGVRVQLREQPQGGVSAVVLLPARILSAPPAEAEPVEPVEAVEAGFAAAGPVEAGFAGAASAESGVAEAGPAPVPSASGAGAAGVGQSLPGVVAEANSNALPSQARSLATPTTEPDAASAAAADAPAPGADENAPEEQAAPGIEGAQAVPDVANAQGAPSAAGGHGALGAEGTQGLPGAADGQAPPTAARSWDTDPAGGPHAAEPVRPDARPAAEEAIPEPRLSWLPTGSTGTGETGPMDGAGLPGAVDGLGDPDDEPEFVPDVEIDDEPDTDPLVVAAERTIQLAAIRGDLRPGPHPEPEYPQDGTTAADTPSPAAPTPADDTPPRGDERASETAPSPAVPRPSDDARALSDLAAADDVRASGSLDIADDLRGPADAPASGDVNTTGGVNNAGEVRAAEDSRGPGDSRVPDEARSPGDMSAAEDVRDSGEVRAAEDVRASGDVGAAQDVRASGGVRGPEDVRSLDGWRSSVEPAAADGPSAQDGLRGPADPNAGDDLPAADDLCVPDDWPSLDAAAPAPGRSWSDSLSSDSVSSGPVPPDRAGHGPMAGDLAGLGPASYDSDAAATAPSDSGAPGSAPNDPAPQSHEPASGEPASGEPTLPDLAPNDLASDDLAPNDEALPDPAPYDPASAEAAAPGSGPAHSGTSERASLGGAADGPSAGPDREPGPFGAYSASRAGAAYQDPEPTPGGGVPVAGHAWQQPGESGEPGGGRWLSGGPHSVLEPDEHARPGAPLTPPPLPSRPKPGTRRADRPGPTAAGRLGERTPPGGTPRPDDTPSGGLPRHDRRQDTPSGGVLRHDLRQDTPSGGVPRHARRQAPGEPGPQPAGGPTSERPMTDTGLPKRTPRAVSRPTPAPRERARGVDAEELRRRLGGFQRGAREGRRDAEAGIGLPVEAGLTERLTEAGRTTEASGTTAWQRAEQPPGTERTERAERAGRAERAERTGVTEPTGAQDEGGTVEEARD